VGGSHGGTRNDSTHLTDYSGQILWAKDHRTHSLVDRQLLFGERRQRAGLVAAINDAADVNLHLAGVSG
jgi:hypothetical protein